MRIKIFADREYCAHVRFVLGSRDNRQRREKFLGSAISSPLPLYRLERATLQKTAL